MSAQTRNPIPRVLAGLYRFVLSPVLHATHRTLTGSSGACRFQPTCSEYAALAVHLHGPLRGSGLALRRLLRCHPFARGGFDPVPDRRPSRAETANPSPSPAESLSHLP